MDRIRHWALGLLLAAAAVLTGCTPWTGETMPPEETLSPEAAAPAPERIYPFCFFASGGDTTPFLSNTTKLLHSEDLQDPTRMAAVFSLQPLSKTETLYLRIPGLSISRETGDTKLELVFFRNINDPELSFRISCSDDYGVTWTELPDSGALETTGDLFSGRRPIMRFAVENLQERIPEGMTVTDLKIEPFSQYTGKQGGFRLIRGAVSCAAEPEAVSLVRHEEPVEWPFTADSAQKTVLKGTVDGQPVSGQSFLSSQGRMEVAVRMFLKPERKCARFVLRVLASKGEKPEVSRILYSLDTENWIGPLDVTAARLENTFVAESLEEYDIYEITAALPRETGALRGIKLEISMNNQDGKGTFHILRADVVWYTQRDDGPMIQKMIDDAKAAGQNEITIPKVNPATGKPGYCIGTTVWLSSDTTVILDGCKMHFMDDAVCNIFASKGAWAERNDPVLMEGQKNIRILGRNGAVFDGGNSNGRTEKTLPAGERMMWNCFVLMRNVDGFEVSGIQARNSRYWCFTFLYGRNGSIHDIEFACRNEKPNQDGIDLRQGCNNIEIYNLTGVTGDDTVALTAVGKLDAWHTVEGIEDIDIHDVSIRNVRAGCSGGHGIIRLLAHDYKKVYNISISDIYDGSLDGNGVPSYSVVRIGDVRYFSVQEQAPGDISGITVKNVVSNSKSAIYVNSDYITKDHITWENVTAENGVVIKLKNETKFYADPQS